MHSDFLSVGSAKIGGRMEEFGGRFCTGGIKQKCIFGPDLFQFYEGYFYYKYRHCISVNLEIEGDETRV